MNPLPLGNCYPGASHTWTTRSAADSRPAMCLRCGTTLPGIGVTEEQALVNRALARASFRRATTATYPTRGVPPEASTAAGVVGEASFWALLPVAAFLLGAAGFALGAYLAWVLP